MISQTSADLELAGNIGMTRSKIAASGNVVSHDPVRQICQRV